MTDRQLSRLRSRPQHDRTRRTEIAQLTYPLLVILTIVITGTAGYSIIEGWPVIDSLYMTVLTLTTIGYGVPYPLTSNGQIFTIILMVLTIGSVGYAFSVLARFLFEGELNRMLRGRRMDRDIARLDGHMIICGCGRTGLHIAEEFSKMRTPFVLIEQDMDRIHNLESHIGDFLYLDGDSTNDDTLRQAGIEKASGLIATLGQDKDNLFLVLTARALNNKLRIIARVSEDENTQKLLRAGADEVISPNAIGALRIASVMLRPRVVNFLDQMLRVPGENLRIEEIAVNSLPALSGKTIAQAAIPQKTGMLVVAIINADDSYRFNPGADTVLKLGDTLIVMGTPEQRETAMTTKW